MSEIPIATDSLLGNLGYPEGAARESGAIGCKDMA